MLMNRVFSLFRKYHRQLSIVTLLPMILVTITGIVIPILEELHFPQAASLMAKLHTGRIFGSDLIYCVLIGLGLLGLIVTGVTMTGLVPKKRPASSD